MVNNDLISRSAIKKFIQDGLNCKDPAKAFGHDAIEILTEIEFAQAIDAVRCEQCLYRSQYANEEGLYKCGVITCKDGHCAMVAPYFSCIAGKKRGKDDGK